MTEGDFGMTLRQDTALTILVAAYGVFIVIQFIGGGMHMIPVSFSALLLGYLLGWNYGERKYN